MKEQQEKLYAHIDSLSKDIKGHQKEIKERESTIGDKVQRIFELRKKNQELEKFKFVLDYKITELRYQIEPKKSEIKQVGEREREIATGARFDVSWHAGMPATLRRRERIVKARWHSSNEEQNQGSSESLSVPLLARLLIALLAGMLTCVPAGLLVVWVHTVQRAAIADESGAADLQEEEPVPAAGGETAQPQT